VTRLEPDVAFERALFDSARHDGPSEDQKRAAYRSLLASGAFVAGGSAALSHGRHLLGLGTAKVAAWVATGALVGSGVTLALLDGGKPRETVATAPTVVVPVPSVAMALPLAEPMRAPSDVLMEPSAVEATPSSSAAARASRNVKPPAVKSHVQSGAAERAPAESTLSREVAALDRARSALWQSDFQSTLRRVEAFHAEFPRSALAPDAESLAIEALRGLGDAHAAAGRAERFLLRYPNDPQAPRVRKPEELP
jgi:hypothetical protein